MQILNLVRQDKSDISYSISRFPDGEVHITLGDIDHKDKVEVRCRITNAEELFILMQVGDILKRHAVPFFISICYLMSMRMDRVMDFNRPFSLSIVCKVLDSLGADSISVFSPHSYECVRLLNTPNFGNYEFEIPFRCENIAESLNAQTVLPDKGAAGKFYYDEDTIFGKKTRDLATGKITSIGIENPWNIGDNPLLVRDDLCDGGGTFVGIAKELRKYKPNAKLYIQVDHMVNPKGIKNLSENFDRVWFTNSYKDWQNESLPDNVEVIEIV
jgi:ribose-phosphate pyrophosphokinase